MADGGHLGFDHSKIIARLTDKHLVDISYPGSSWPSLSEKPPQHIFANGTSGLILHININTIYNIVYYIIILRDLVKCMWNFDFGDISSISELWNGLES